MKPSVIQQRFLNIQICVPKDWTDEQAEEFANEEISTGITSKWEMVHDNDDMLNGDPERAQCDDDPEYIHIVLNC